MSFVAAAAFVAVQFSTNLASAGLVTLFWIWPRVRDKPLHEALQPFVAVHMSRTLGLFALVPDIDGAYAAGTRWALHIAIGDFATAVLAIGALVLLRRKSPIAIAAVWVMNVWGSLDFAYGTVNAFPEDILGHGLYPYIAVVTFGVPVLIVAHAVIFALLLRRREEA